MFLMSSRACTANLSGAVAQREPGPILGPNGESKGTEADQFPRMASRSGCPVVGMCRSFSPAEDSVGIECVRFPEISRKFAGSPEPPTVRTLKGRPRATEVRRLRPTRRAPTVQPWRTRGPTHRRSLQSSSPRSHRGGSCAAPGDVAPLVCVVAGGGVASVRLRTPCTQAPTSPTEWYRTRDW